MLIFDNQTYHVDFDLTVRLLIYSMWYCKLKDPGKKFQIPFILNIIMPFGTANEKHDFILKT